ncbi:hypothetical protein AMECASPLE_007719 [Ameca splendens]|uniref:Secreted protein n=1 Tax=Ameca splendens TaxID=208324 RepID=A0ABV0ZWX2_9TELE
MDHILPPSSPPTQVTKLLLWAELLTIWATQFLHRGASTGPPVNFLLNTLLEATERKDVNFLLRFHLVNHHCC